MKSEPARMPSRPPTAQRVMASSVNCRRMFVLRGADGFADADFAGALGDGDQHDVHHADAADHEADG